MIGPLPLTGERVVALAVSNLPDFFGAATWGGRSASAPLCNPDRPPFALCRRGPGPPQCGQDRCGPPRLAYLTDEQDDVLSSVRIPLKLEDRVKCLRPACSRGRPPVRAWHPPHELFPNRIGPQVLSKRPMSHLSALPSWSSPPATLVFASSATPEVSP